MNNLGPAGAIAVFALSTMLLLLTVLIIRTPALLQDVLRVGAKFLIAAGLL